MALVHLAVVVGAFAVAASIVWYSMKTGIAPMPSSAAACRAMLEAAERVPAGTIVDLGSGWGTLAIAFARRHPEREVVGYELSWVPWLVSRLRRRLLGLTNLTLHRADFLRARLPQQAVLVCYLCRRNMRDLSHKLRSEPCRPVAVICNTFAMPFMRPCEVIRLSDIYRTRIFVYRPGAHPLRPKGRAFPCTPTADPGGHARA
jgi:hypothetical protein